MKMLNMVFSILLAANMVYANSPEAPTLKLSVADFMVSAIWNNIVTASGYKLYYAPYPQAQPIGNFDMGLQQEMSATLAANSAFYVAVTAYHSEGESGYSNIEHFVLSDQTQNVPPSNEHKTDRMLIVISAPSIHDEYYRESFEKIIAFDIQYAKAIMGKDNVVVLADKDTLPYFKNKLPADVLLEAEVEDIWMRDFSTVHPSKMVKFAYDRPQERSIERSFLDFATENELLFKNSPLKVDGGNVVDNNKDRIILTDKVLERNPNQSRSQIISTLKAELGATEIAIIPMDEEYLGHSDGMVMFIDDDTILVNDYNEDPDFKQEVLTALKKGLPTVKIHEIEGVGYGKAYGNYASACGIYVNAVVTYNYIYVPTFGDSAKDNTAVQKIQELTNKTVVPVDVQNVCFLGGNTRCLSWQITGDNAQKMIEAAKRY
jgi:agmatine/peptidylarginine deiminase